MLGNRTLAGVYHGVIEKARIDNGVMWARVHVPALDTPTSKFITRWARFTIPWGTFNYGIWGSPHKGEHVLVAFEDADPERPWIIGYIPNPQEGFAEMPPEFVNDDYADKTPFEGQRDDPPGEKQPINPAFIAKSPQWQQYFLLHDKLKRVVIRVCDTGGGECPNLPGQEKPAIELGELAKHNVLLGDLFMELYNRHRHKDVLPGPFLSGPPIEDDQIKCEEHLSHVVYVIRDPWDQPPSPRAQAMREVGQQLLGSSSGGAGGGGTGSGGEGLEETVRNIVETATKFCSDPAGCIGDMARSAGLPGDVIEEGVRLVGNLIGPLFDAAKKIAKSVGYEIPDVQDLCGMAQALADRNLGEVMVKAVPMALSAIGIPTGVVDGVIGVAKGLMDLGKSTNDIVKAVGEAFGAQGLAALAGCFCSAFGG
jgi:hypothetical protein